MFYVNHIAKIVIIKLIKVSIKYLQIKKNYSDGVGRLLKQQNANCFIMEVYFCLLNEFIQIAIVFIIL